MQAIYTPILIAIYHLWLTQLAEQTPSFLFLVTVNLILKVATPFGISNKVFMQAKYIPICIEKLVTSNLSY